MLERLEINNLAVMSKAVFEPETGLNVISGETGAGKSLLVDAILLITGRKANKDMIRTGSDFLLVEAIFDVAELRANKSFFELLDVNGINYEDNQLIISRRISRDGKSLARVNGSTVLLSLLKELTGYLIDIHGQHDTQIIFDENRHIDILDAFGGGNLKEKFEDYTISLNEYRAIIRKIREVNSSFITETEAVYLRSACSEISKENLVIGDDLKVEEEYSKIKSQIDKMNCWNKINQLLNGEVGNESDDAPITRLKAALQNFNYLSKISETDEIVKEAEKRMNNMISEFEDISLLSARMCSDFELKAEKMIEVEKKLDRINLLKSKYGNTIEDILEFERLNSEKLRVFDDKEKVLKELKHQRGELEQRLLSCANELSEVRHQKALVLSKLIVEQLGELNMQDSRFDVKFISHAKEKFFSSKGHEDVVFLFSGNPGEELKPLSSIVSGGEASRIMLAIKTILSDFDTMPTMIFDEIDTGVSGMAANAIARKLSIIGQKHQVLCVSHLSAIAAAANYNFYLSKDVIENNTVTNLTKLDYNGKINEVARLMTGMVDDESLKLSKQLIDKISFSSK